MDPARVRAFQRKVLAHDERHRRLLPWRATTDPYAILVSEVMLQQTQADRVIPYYRAWISRWPTVQALARARLADVLATWSGLGYNRRAVFLHRAAQAIAAGGGDVLRSVREQKLPGIGPYTFRAVQIFAANADIVTVDTNIRRILIHEFALPESVPDHELIALAERCLPRGRSRDWHNALMDYGAAVLTARQTGIRPLTRQSRFEGSDRQLRGRLLRLLLAGPQTIPSIERALTDPRLDQVLVGLERDGLVERRGRKIALAGSR
ncbi:MAG: Fe-S cluster assembly protein HesB [Candidatus Aenigmarchaeota archaeon]|nr:Fe-S cluster assembly protein HesB [Candidatus Aenigmarchaeota archaeon]